MNRIAQSVGGRAGLASFYRWRGLFLRSCRGFTLIELLVVIAIVGVLAALLLPVLGSARSHAESMYCLNNLKQLQVCWHSYTHDNQDVIPPNNFVYSVTNAFTFPLALRHLIGICQSRYELQDLASRCLSHPFPYPLDRLEGQADEG